jgi:hypothetical protein
VTAITPIGGYDAKRRPIGFARDDNLLSRWTPRLLWTDEASHRTFQVQVLESFRPANLLQGMPVATLRYCPWIERFGLISRRTPRASGFAQANGGTLPARGSMGTRCARPIAPSNIAAAWSSAASPR